MRKEEGYVTNILNPIFLRKKDKERIEKIQVGIETVEGERFYVDVINSRHKIKDIAIGDKVLVEFAFRANDSIPGKVFNNLNCHSITKIN